MRGIAKQCQPSLAPSLGRIAIVERPFVPAIAIGVEAQQVGMPAGVSCRYLRKVAFSRPRFLNPRVAVEMRDNVDKFAAPHGVMHDMAMRAHPHRTLRTLPFRASRRSR